MKKLFRIKLNNNGETHTFYKRAHSSYQAAKLGVIELERLRCLRKGALSHLARGVGCQVEEVKYAYKQEIL